MAKECPNFSGCCGGAAVKLGIDISVVQTPHRMRGIGATAINFIKSLPTNLKEKHEVVLFMYKENQEAALNLLGVDAGDFVIRFIEKENRQKLKLPGRLNKLNIIVNSINDLLNTRRGDPRIDKADLQDLDIYLQFDQMQIPPRRRGLRVGVILYDLIPYIMEADYLQSFSTARHNGDRLRGAVNKALIRRKYLSRVKQVCGMADHLFAISEHTKHDFIRYCGITPSRIQVVHLGVGEEAKKSSTKTPDFCRYSENSWGYFPENISLSDKPFILFVGGADPRRRLSDLVAAYNNLKARGEDVRLVFAGDTMKGPKTIPVPHLQKYLLSSSYLEDIVFLGFVSDEQREWLYSHATAFVYPSTYEGFGLPILEAMQYGTPVITYKNSSISEIAEKAAIYTEDSLTIRDAVLELMHDDQVKQRYARQGPLQAKKFAWSKTTEKILKELLFF